MITTLAITAAIVVIVVLIGMYAAFGHCIPDGCQDDDGFHHGKPPAIGETK